MRNLLILSLALITTISYTQNSIPLEWDVSNVNNCDDDGNISISEDGSTIEAVGLEGPDCMPCQSLSASGVCTLPGNGSLCSSTPNVITTLVDRSGFASVSLNLSIQPISSNLECNPCSTSDLAFINVLTIGGEELLSLSVCGSDEADVGELDLPASCENFVVILVGFKSNGGDEGFVFEVSANGIGESEMNRVDLTGLVLDINQIGCPGDTSMIVASISDCTNCEISYRLADGSINTNGMIPVPLDFTNDAQLIDLLITSQCGTTEVPSISIPVINNPQICDGVINTNPSIFEQFPFLIDDYEGCTDIEFQIITSGIFTFVYASDGVLFFEDGTLYCTEIGDRDCRALYNLYDMPTVIDSCGVAKDEDKLTIVISESYIDEEANTICANVTTNGIEDLLSFQFQIESELEPVSFVSNIVDESTIVVTDEDSLFVIKSLWIAGDLIPIQLSDTDPIYTVCFDRDIEAGVYGFILRDTERLFSQFVVRSSTGSFSEIRDIEVNGSIEIVGEDQSDGENMDGDQMDMDEEMDNDEMDMDEEMDNDEIDGDNMEGDQMDMNMDSVGIISEAFELFPWLQDIDVCGDTVASYSFGDFIFVSIGTSGDLDLYVEDGTFYCSNTESFDCLAFYELGQPADSWVCPPEVGSLVAQGGQLKSVVADVVVFPNPFTDYIEIETTEDIDELRIFDSDGREYPFNKSAKKSRINVSLLKSGAYYLSIKTVTNTTIKRIIKI